MANATWMFLGALSLAPAFAFFICAAVFSLVKQRVEKTS